MKSYVLRNRVIKLIVLVTLFSLFDSSAFAVADYAKPDATCQNISTNTKSRLSTSYPAQNSNSLCRRIYFTRYDDSGGVIWSMNPNGEDQRKVMSGFSPKLSPDGKLILFLNYTPTGYHIFVANVDGTNTRQLTVDDPSAPNPPFRYHLTPVWSPDGKQIAYSSGVDIANDRDGLSIPFDIWIMKADGTSKLQLTHDINFDRDPTWSPDGTKIAYMKNTDVSYSGPSNIYVMNNDGTNQINLSNSSFQDFHPSWSPDGNQIAFVTNSGDHFPEIYTMRPDGSDRKRVTFVSQVDSGIPLFYAYFPSWSPNSKRIIFTRVPTNNANMEIFSLDIKTNRLENLTNNSKQDLEGSWA